jgi:AcrR family transcriptional regulator
MPRLTERTRDARRRQILDAARRCFARNGFHATSMQDIFIEAGLSAGAVYSHFSGKDEIVAAIADEVIETVTEALAWATAGDPPSLDDLFEHLFTTLQRANVATIAITVWAEALRDPALGRRLSSRYRRMRRELTELVAAYQRRGTIDSQTSASAVAQVLTALGPAFLHQRAFDGSVSAATFARGLQALLCLPSA